ncbi:MAG: YceD family protein [Rhodothermales bacterium]
MVSIKITGFEPGVYELTLSPRPEELELEPDLFRNIEVDARLERKPDSVFVSLQVAGIARLQCDRTLVEFDYPVEAGYEVLFAPPEMVESLDAAQDVRLLRPEDEEIELTEVIRDTLLLAIPQRRVAPGAEDIDLQTRFGGPSEGDVEVDPRWAVLQALRDQHDESSERG